VSPTGWQGVYRLGGRFEVWLVAVLTQNDIISWAPQVGWEWTGPEGGLESVWLQLMYYGPHRLSRCGQAQRDSRWGRAGV
jgi:hypothetical protein